MIIFLYFSEENMRVMATPGVTWIPARGAPVVSMLSALPMEKTTDVNVQGDILEMPDLGKQKPLFR